MGFNEVFFGIRLGHSPITFGSKTNFTILDFFELVASSVTFMVDGKTVTLTAETYRSSTETRLQRRELFGSKAQPNTFLVQFFPDVVFKCCNIRHDYFNLTKNDFQDWEEDLYIEVKGIPLLYTGCSVGLGYSLDSSVYELEFKPEQLVPFSDALISLKQQNRIRSYATVSMRGNCCT